jgi:hypothetical protein
VQRVGVVGDDRLRVKTKIEMERQQKRYRYCSSQEGAEKDEKTKKQEEKE